MDRPKDTLFIAKDKVRGIYYLRITSDVKRRVTTLKKFDKLVGLDFRPFRLYTFKDYYNRLDVKRFIEKSIGKHRCIFKATPPHQPEATIITYQLSPYLAEKFIESIRFEYPMDSVFI